MNQITTYILEHLENSNFSILEHLENSNFSIIERLRINKDIKSHNYHPTTRDELKELIDKLLFERGDNANLNDIDTSEITDMSELFFYSEFNGDISEWNVSNVKNMYDMFYCSEFTGENGDISKWDVSNVKDMDNMFYGCIALKNKPSWYKE